MSHFDLSILPQPPGFFRYKLGSTVVTCLNDGVLAEDAGVLRGIDPSEAARVLKRAFLPESPLVTVNGFLVQSETQTVLIDTGCGTKMGPTAGKLLQNLRAAGVEPSEINLILLTHLHPDHVGGLIDDDGHAVFANAELRAHKADAELFLNADKMASAPAPARVVFETAQAAVGAYGRRFATFEAGEVTSGIEVVPLAGHSPGHCGFRIADKGESLLIWGDIVHLPGLQARHPEVGMIFDADPDLATSQRKRSLEAAAASADLVAGMHLQFPGFAHVAARSDGFEIVPLIWTP